MISVISGCVLPLDLCVCAVSAMLFEAGIILGAHSEAVAYPVLSGSSHTHWPYLQLERTVNVYWLHANCACCYVAFL